MMLALVAAISLSQAPVPSDPNQLPTATDEQKCQMACAQKILECQMPCAPPPNQQNDPKARKQFMECTKVCAAKNKPCLDACEKKDKKKKE